MRAQQRTFDTFRTIYNEERPHEALGQKPPATRYAPSVRAYPTKLLEPAYGDDSEVRRVRHHGHVKWRGHETFIGEALSGELVGISEAEQGPWAVHFGPMLLGNIDEDGRLQRPRPRKDPFLGRDAVKVSPMSPG